MSIGLYIKYCSNRGFHTNLFQNKWRVTSPMKMMFQHSFTAVIASISIQYESGLTKISRRSFIINPVVIGDAKYHPGILIKQFSEVGA